MKIKSGYVQNSKNIQGEQLTKDSFFSKPTISTSILIIAGKFQFFFFFLRNLKSMGGSPSQGAFSVRFSTFT